MRFSIPVEIGFQVLNKFIKEDIPYRKFEAEDDDSEVFSIDIAVDDDYVDQATDIVNQITGGQKTRSQKWQPADS